MRHLTDTNDRSDAHIFAFDSMADVTSYVDAGHHRRRDAGFVGRQGLATWAQVDETTKAVWAEGVYTVQQYIERLLAIPLPEVKDRSRKVRYSNDEGDDIDLDRLRNGDDYWRRAVREETKGTQEVTIVTDTTTPANKRSDDILWRGAAAIALCHILESKGYRVELWVVNGSQLYSGKRHPVITAAKLKGCGDPLDISTLTNVVAGWFYRTVTFALLDTICAKQGERVAGGYGSCYSPRPADLDRLSADQNRIYSAGCYSFDGALGVIEAEIAKLAAANS